MGKIRLDLLLLEKGLVSTRSKSQELIRSGKVQVEGKVSLQPGEKVSPEAKLFLMEAESPYVSRGGHKLEAALFAFQIPVAGARALDLGQSTGGFTQCLLGHGATEVVGVEVGHGQLAPSLRADPRVRCLERQDIRSLAASALAPGFSLCVGDLSFISLSLVVPVLPPFLQRGAHVVLLVKPQFELGPKAVGSGGIVRNAQSRARALEEVERVCKVSGFTVAGAMESPIEGGDGNREYLLHLRWLSN